MKRVLLALIGLVLLTSCDYGIKEGEVVKKWYEPPHTWVQMVPVTTMSGKVMITNMIPMTHFDDEDWCIQIEKWDEESQEWRRRTLYVNPSIYNALEVGSWFAIEQGCQTTDKVRKKRN